MLVLRCNKHSPTGLMCREQGWHVKIFGEMSVITRWSMRSKRAVEFSERLPIAQMDVAERPIDTSLRMQ